MLFSLAVLAVLASVQGRAVNISNTWVLPEEGFPVFYRYFRDRISWYEADAVCQFHHANLVTVDTTAQYDAVRAYLKELDISSAVWVGLIRSNPDGDFTWTDYRGLSGDGYWSSAPDTRSAPLCAAADPVADYRWEARACGGPMVASFICELPVPQWALGSEGCMVRALPALTVLYLPESAAVQLTADCGLAGVKRVQCTGNVKRDDLLKDLSCADEAEETTSNVTSEITISPVTTEIATEQETSEDVVADENITTEHEDDINQQNFIRVTPIPYQIHPIIREEFPINRIPISKDINFNMIHDTNLESNEIQKIGDEHNFLSEEESNKLEDEKHMQHKQLHNELARLGNIGNFEKIFSQPADHFVPPLVMAKAHISDDMTVLSLEQKHAQQLAEQRVAKHKIYGILDYKPQFHQKDEVTTEKATTTELPLITTIAPAKLKDGVNKDAKTTKYGSSKKYNEKYFDQKSKNYKLEKSIKSVEKVTLPTLTQTSKDIEATTMRLTTNGNQLLTNDHSVELSVILKEPFTDVRNTSVVDVTKQQNEGTSTITTYKDNNTQKNASVSTLTEVSTEPFNEMTHEVIKITILNEDNSHAKSTEFDITTKIPVKESSLSTEEKQVTISQVSNLAKGTSKTEPAVTPETTVTTFSIKTEPSVKSTHEQQILTTFNSIMSSTAVHDIVNIVSTKAPEITTTTSLSSEKTLTPIISMVVTEINTENNKTSSIAVTDTPVSTTPSQNTPTEVTNRNDTESQVNDHEGFHDIEDLHEESLNSSETEIDDFQSPLLSAANEPLHRPNRSRRPQQTQNRIKKFNPFRILG